MEDFMDKGVFILMAILSFMLMVLSAWMGLHYLIEGCVIGGVCWTMISMLWIIPAAFCIKIAAMA